MKQDNERVEPEMQQNKIGSFSSFYIVVKVHGLEMEFWGEAYDLSVVDQSFCPGRKTNPDINSSPALPYLPIVAAFR